MDDRISEDGASRWPPRPLPAAPCAPPWRRRVEVSFFYPRRRRRADHQADRRSSPPTSEGEPGIKVKPIYAGTYQETIVKALTAHKAGTPPVTSVLLSTDMFTLIDEDAIVPIDNFVKTATTRPGWASFYPAFMLNSQTGGKTWGIPFQRSTIVLYWNKELFKEAGLDPNKPPPDLGRAGRPMARS
jgi:sn-glycerol 3-phosphate transport system substrate-binding protein